MINRAVILTGGDGLRLRPLTCTKPKAMLPVCGTPVIDYTLNALAGHGFKTVFIAADRLSNVITDRLDESPDVDFIISSVPEGTCRPVARAAEVCGLAENEGIAVLYGDVLFETDLSAALEYHSMHAAEVTLVTYSTDRPSGCTLVSVEDGFVSDIIPTPARESCASELAASGIFILNGSAAAKAVEYEDLLTGFIPALIKDGVKVLNFTAKGTFIDINTTDDLFTASNAVFEGLVPPLKKISENSADCPEAKFTPPAYIAKSADIAPYAEIGKRTVIGENVTVCRGAKLNGAVIMDGAYIGERATVNSAVIGTGARLLSGAAVYEGAAVGDSAVIAEQAVVKCGVKIWNGRHIDSYACAEQDIKYGFLTPAKIGEDGICGETGGVITPQTAAVLGSSLASLGGKIGIGWKDNHASKSLALAIASGVTAAGAEAWLFGNCTAPALAFCTARSRLSAGCRVDAGVTAKISLCSGDGLPLSGSEEKIVEGGLNRGEYRRAGFMHFGQLRDTEAILGLYKNMLEECAPKSLSGIKAVLNTSGGAVSDMCGDIMKRIGDKNGEPIVFHIGSDGKGVSAYTEETGYVFEERLILICCAERFAEGKDVSLPYDFPRAADRLAERYGRTVLRYSGCPSDSSDRDARRLAAETPFVRDGAALALTVLKVLESRGITLAEAAGELPEMALATRFVAVDKHPVKLLRQICTEEQASGDGIVVNDKRGRVMIRPVKTEKGVMMKVESFSMEAASELCDFYQDKLKQLERNNCGL
ncbi:MAG: sugar phosphate nucleotidyltransferase [Prevotella sp.]|nr:sugar phosphate nucleotidyltransferase [Prevotella sp.]